MGDAQKAIEKVRDAISYLGTSTDSMRLADAIKANAKALEALHAEIEALKDAQRLPADFPVTPAASPTAPDKGIFGPPTAAQYATPPDPDPAELDAWREWSSNGVMILSDDRGDGVVEGRAASKQDAEDLVGAHNAGRRAAIKRLRPKVDAAKLAAEIWRDWSGDNVGVIRSNGFVGSVRHALRELGIEVEG